MTMRLDLRKRLDVAQPGRGVLGKTIYSSRPYGCADCGEWFATAQGQHGLMAHVCHERGQEYVGLDGDGNG